MVSMPYVFPPIITRMLAVLCVLITEPAAAEELSFTYGTQTPQITCGLLNLCDITLESGEKI